MLKHNYHNRFKNSFDIIEKENKREILQLKVIDEKSTAKIILWWKTLLFPPVIRNTEAPLLITSVQPCTDCPNKHKIRKRNRKHKCLK